jgi:hypothetical protein
VQASAICNYNDCTRITVVRDAQAQRGRRRWRRALLWLSVADGRSYFGGSTLTVAVGPMPAVRSHIGSFPEPS